MASPQPNPKPLTLLAALSLLLLVPTADPLAPDKPNVGEAARPQAAPRPKQSLKEILLGTYQAFGDDRTLAVSAGTTFYGLLALFPAIASFVSIFSLFADSGRISDELTVLAGFLPGGAVEIVREQVARITSKGGAALSGAFALGLVTSLWSANAGIKAMFDALNVAYGLKERRNFFRLNVASLAFTLGFIAITAIAAILLVALPQYLERFVGDAPVSWAVTIGRWPALFAFLSLAIALLYRFGPTPQDQKWRWLTPGSIVAAFAWCVVSTAFSYYAAHFGSYNATYGSLGAAIGLMTWMWLSITVILLGAELNAQIDRSTDTKREQPI